MTRTFVEDVSGRDDDNVIAPAMPGRPEQKSWSVLLERKIKAVIGNDQIKVEKIQQPVNGQWLIVIDGSFVVHRPAKTVASIYRIENTEGQPLSQANIGAAIFVNLVDEKKPSARVKNETVLFNMLVDELRRKHPELPIRSAMGTLDALTKSGDEPVEEKKAEPEKPVAVRQQGSRIKRRARMTAVEDEPASVYGPLKPLIENVDAVINHKCMVVDAVDSQGASVPFAVNVYLPIEELVNNRYEIVEHIHLLSIIDEHSYQQHPHHLERDESLQAVQITKEDMESGRVVDLLNEFFKQFEVRGSFIYSDGTNIAIPQDLLGQQMFVLALFSMARAPVRRHSVKVWQTCKHPMPAVESALHETRIKTVYTAPLLEPKGD